MGAILDKLKAKIAKFDNAKAKAEADQAKIAETDQTKKEVKRIPTQPPLREFFGERIATAHVADRTGYKTGTIRNWCKLGKLSYVIENGRYYVCCDEKYTALQPNEKGELRARVRALEDENAKLRQQTFEFGRSEMEACIEKLYANEKVLQAKIDALEAKNKELTESETLMNIKYNAACDLREKLTQEQKKDKFTIERMQAKIELNQVVVKDYIKANAGLQKEIQTKDYIINSLRFENGQIRGQIESYQRTILVQASRSDQPEKQPVEFTVTQDGKQYNLVKFSQV